MIGKMLKCIIFGMTTQLHSAEPKQVETVERGATRYLVWRVAKADLGRLQMHWLDTTGRPLANFGGLRQHLATQGLEVEFATNAGIYERGPKPCGLTVCQGREVVALNLKEGEGNFYLKPNGVFYVDDKGDAGVMEAAAFGRAGIKPRIATQSGPILLDRGVIHPAFDPQSKNLRQRSAVGVRKADGQVVFVMTDRADAAMRTVSFHALAALAALFLELGCEEALFLDGDLSDYAVNPTATTVFRPQTYAAMFALVRRR
jgi:uncharacterized protein YigE (DUF2233 family)